MVELGSLCCSFTDEDEILVETSMFGEEFSAMFKFGVTNVVTVVEVTETVIYNQYRIVFHYKKSRG